MRYVIFQYIARDSFIFFCYCITFIIIFQIPIFISSVQTDEPCPWTTCFRYKYLFQSGESYSVMIISLKISVPYSSKVLFLGQYLLMVQVLGTTVKVHLLLVTMASDIPHGMTLTSLDPRTNLKCRKEINSCCFKAWRFGKCLLTHHQLDYSYLFYTE